ncbi:unnamed protein product [Trichobilharzia regenti]|nr:unnamed protein product [Trichobilharzia regenti]
MMHTAVIAIIFTNLKCMPRQLIYTGCLSCSNVITNILFAWLWLFPAKGLPFATKGHIYYFISNASRLACRLFRFHYSLSTTFTSNLILCSAIDRCLSIFYPVSFSRWKRRHAWYVCLIVFVVSGIMMLPFVIIVDWIQIGRFHICWLDEREFRLQVYHTIFANLGLVQSTLIVIVNVAFITRLRIQFKKTGGGGLAYNKKELKHITISTILLAFSMSYVLTALPQTTVYLLAFLWSHSKGNMIPENEVSVRMMYNLADIGWNIHFLRELVDLFMYFVYLKPLRRTIILKTKQYIKTITHYDLNSSDHIPAK